MLSTEDGLNIPSDSGHIELIHQAGFDVYATDITPEQAANFGLKIVQAVIPGIVPLYLGNRVADEVAWKRLPTTIGGVMQTIPPRLNSDFHPWP
jgi:hypothetical protein